ASAHRPAPRLVAFAALLLVFGLRLPARADVAKPLQDAYKEFNRYISPTNLRATINTLAGFGSRVSGYPGDLKAGDYVAQQFRSLGMANVQVDEFPVTVPYDLGVEDKSKGAFAELRVAGKANHKLPMYPLWPNLVRTPTLPVNGLTAPLIYVGDG